jgi:transposase-like protein
MPKYSPFVDNSTIAAHLMKSSMKELVGCCKRPIDFEVDAFIETHQERTDSDGRRLIVKNGSLPARKILTGAGAIQVKQGRVRDNSPISVDRVQFSPSVLPAYLRRTESIEELLPWLYLKGISTSGMGEALQSLLGENQRQRRRPSQGAVEQ